MRERHTVRERERERESLIFISSFTISHISDFSVICHLLFSFLFLVFFFSYFLLFISCIFHNFDFQGVEVGNFVAVKANVGIS